MAEIVDTLRLDIDQALRDIQGIETALDRSLASVDVRLDTTLADRQLVDLARTADRALDDVDLEIDTSQAQELEQIFTDIERISGRAATETESLALAAGRAEVNFEDVARALGVSEDQARDMTREILEAQAAANRLEDASRDVARQLGLSDAEAERLTRSLREADRAAEAIDVTSIGVGQRFAALRTSAAAIAATLAGIGGGAILGAALTGANAAIQSFARLEDSINAVRVVFGAASTGVLQFGEDAARSAGLSQEAFNQAVVPIGSLLQNFGFDAQEASAAAVTLVQRGADLASVYGGSVQDALLAVGAALRGEADPLERYGASISAARVETFALAQGLAATKAELTPAILLQARYGLILSDTSKVAGDFANTSGDLANAQRSAAAAAANFGNDIGEVLAPALESILVLLPEVLEGVRQLVPGFAAAGESAAGFFESVGQGGGFRTEFAAIKAGFDIVTGGAGLAKEGVGSLLSIFTGDFQGAVSSVQRGGALIERALTRGIGVTLANALDKGTDAVTAFNTAMRQTAASSQSIDLFKQNYQDFAIAAGLSALQLRDVTQGMIDNAGAAGLTASEIQFLITQLALLNSSLFTDIEAVREFNRATRELAESDPFSTVTSRFTTFSTDVDTATDAAAASLAELAAAAERQQARTAAAFDLFAELPERLKGSFTAAVDALREQVEARIDFDINLAILRALNLDALADEFQTQGVAAAGQLAAAVNDIPEAIEADLLLQGFGDIGEAGMDALVARFVAAGLTATDARQLAETLASPEVIAAAAEAGVKVGNAQGGGYERALAEKVNQLIPETATTIGELISAHWHLGAEAETEGEETGQSFLDGVLARVTPESIRSAIGTFSLDIDLDDEGWDMGDSLIGGFLDAIAAAKNRIGDIVESTTRSAFEMQSPSKLMLRLGKQAGDDLWSGFNQSSLTLKTAIPAVAGSIVAAPATAATGTGGDVIFNLPDLETRDADVTIARATQLAGSVAGYLNGRFKL